MGGVLDSSAERRKREATIAGTRADQNARHPVELERGASVGRYIVVERLGAGAMGVVYAAYDPELDRRVAVKLLHPSKEERKGSMGRSRLLREAQALARLSHPNVVAVHDVGTAGGRVFVAMEFVEGQTLGAWLAAQERSVAEILEVFLTAGGGLVAAHEADMTHRDFKPENVMLGDDGRVRVMDFGLARRSDTVEIQEVTEPQPEDTFSKLESLSRLDSRLTQTGAVLGTPAYMPPEQHLGAEAGPAADQFAYCVALYEALYGERPFDGDTPAALWENVLGGRVREVPKDRRVPTRLRKLLLRGLASDPANRWPTLAMLLAEIERVQARKSWRVIVPAIGGLTALSVLLWSAGREDSAEVCTDSAERLGVVWGAGEKANIESSFAATGLPLAAETFPRVVTALDTYAQGWVEAHREACEATHVRSEQSGELLDLRMDCLRRRLGHLEATIGVLSQASAPVVEHAVETVAHLAPTGQCADFDFLRAAVRPPEDLRTAALVDGVRAKIGESRAQQLSGDYEKALALAEEAAAAAEDAGYAPSIAESLVQLGRMQIRLTVAESRQTLERGWWTAIASGHDPIAIEAAVELARGHGRDPMIALQWSRHASAFIERSQPGEIVEAEVLAVESVAHLQANDFEAARDRQLRALEIQKRLLPGDPLVGRSLAHLGTIAREQGRFDVALEHYREARAVFVETFGPSHPEVSELEVSMASALHNLGELEQARAHAERGVELAAAAFGPDHPSLATRLIEVANALAKMRRYDEASAYYARAAALAARTRGPQSRLVAQTLSNWGVTLDFAGRYEESWRKHEEALTISRTHDVRPDDPWLGILHDNLGSALQGLGRYDEALEHHRVALPIWETLGAEHPDLGISLRDQARAWIGAGRPERAVPLVQRALTIFSSIAIDPLELAQTELVLARALWPQPSARGVSAERRKRALGLAEQARKRFGEAGERGGPLVREAEAWLAARD